MFARFINFGCKKLFCQFARYVLNPLFIEFYSTTRNVDCFLHEISNNFDILFTAQTIFKAWLENGIHMSKCTVVFLTKKFLTHNYCRYQADNAVVRYVKSKGRHRVIVIMLQSCKIPKNLQHFNCVYAWRFRENPEEQYARILKAISGEYPFLSATS